jgi:hypothetical protein
MAYLWYSNWEDRAPFYYYLRRGAVRNGCFLLNPANSFNAVHKYLQQIFGLSPPKNCAFGLEDNEL